jgi:hypothetical protein
MVVDNRIAERAVDLLEVTDHPLKARYSPALRVQGRGMVRQARLGRHGGVWFGAVQQGRA